MMAAGLSAKAQGITITLYPGCTWISYPNTEVMDIPTALGDFVPMEGDIIKSQNASAVYHNGIWIGLENFTPGRGYKYYSNRSEIVEFVFSRGFSSVTTAEPIDITATSALVGGTVNMTEGGHVFLRGVCWGTEPGPNIDGNHTTNGTSIGDFSETLVGLTPGTVYYVRAYAYNSLGVGYGNQVSFTTLNGLAEVSVQSINNITATAASAVAEVLNDGGFSVTSRGICWGTAPMPTISNTHTSNGAGTGRFSVDMPQLQPGTVYYVRAYAQNRAGVSYSEQLTFSTASGLPVLTTRPASQVTSTSAVAGGSISDDGGFPVIRRGVCYSTVPQPTVDGFHTTDGSGTGSFTSQLLNLASGTHYYFRAYATNSVGTVYGEQFEFVTQ